MSLVFLLDEDVSYRVAVGLRTRDINAVSVHEIGRADLEIADEEQLVFAAAQGRVLVTYNRRDYQELDARWRERGKAHFGIIWCSERTIMWAVSSPVSTFFKNVLACPAMAGTS